jgi:hypothetical protein
MLARTFILFDIIAATADAAASPIFHPHQGCGLECCVGDWVLECPAGWTTYNGKCYKAASYATNKWSEARTACESEGAFLVTINDAAENAFVHNLCDGNECWIGGNDLSVEAGTSTDASAWQWHNGETSGYSNFAYGEPNDYGGATAAAWRHGEDCLHMKSNGQWNDESCAIANHNSGAARGIYHGGAIGYTCEKLPSTKTCTRSPHGPLRVWHNSITHSHHRCFLDDNEPNGCRCMCADMAFDGTESTLACAAGYEPLGGKCVLPTHCGSLEGDKTLATFDSHAQWMNGTYSERNGNISDTGDAYAAHCRPTMVSPFGHGILFSDHEKVRIVATIHDFDHNVVSTMRAPHYGSENNWKINGECSMGSGGTTRYDWWNDPDRTPHCGDSYSTKRSYSSDYLQQRQHNMVLGSGTHELVIEDSYGDGWSGGYLTLSYENGTEILSTQGKNFGMHGYTRRYECNDDRDDGGCYRMTIEFTVEPTITNAVYHSENLKCDWESPPINIDNTGFNQHSIGALDITTKATSRRKATKTATTATRYGSRLARASTVAAPAQKI